MHCRRKVAPSGIRDGKRGRGIAKGKKKREKEKDREEKGKFAGTNRLTLLRINSYSRRHFSGEWCGEGKENKRGGGGGREGWKGALTLS